MKPVDATNYQELTAHAGVKIYVCTYVYGLRILMKFCLLLRPQTSI